MKFRRASLGWGREKVFYSSRMRVMPENAGFYFTKLPKTYKIG